jgi:hypothetical protein
MADPAEASGVAETEGKREERERSTIEFPYMDLDDALQVAEALHNSTGSAACQPDMLAQRLSLSMTSSSFRARISTAKMFGLVETDRNGSGYRLTELGQRAVDSATRRRALVEAFTSVPLYRRVYEANRGRQLPPSAALEREMATFGVVPKQTDRARQTFERSAAAAGFFEAGRDRLIMPHVGEAPPPQDDREKGGGSPPPAPPGPPLPPQLDVVIAALIQKLPTGGSFSADARVRWLKQIEMAFQDAYGDEGEIEIKKASSTASPPPS